MDGRKADMVFTDPPYGINLDADYSSAKSNPRMLKDKGLKGGRRYSNVIGDDQDFNPARLIAAFDYCREQFWWGADYYAERIPQKNSGSWIVWDKRLEESADRMFGSCFEMCWSRQSHKRDVARVKWACVFGTEHEPAVGGHKRVHPTQKPIRLAMWFFERWGDHGDVVVDFFGGSGSTLIACDQASRQARVLEIDPAYTDVIVTRWQNLTGKSATLEGDGRTFAEIKAERLPEVAAA